METFNDYVEAHSKLITFDAQKSIDDLFITLDSKLNSNSIVYTVGNGGSHSTAEHFSADLNLNFKRTGNSIKSICASSQIASYTALANDFSFESALAFYLENFIQEKDILIAFTASGNSENILRAISMAIKHNSIIYAFSGFSGGKVLTLNGIRNIHIPSQDGLYGEIENLHLMICHYIIDKLKGQGH